MKYISKSVHIPIPEGVTVEAKAKIIKVTGPRGTIVKNLKHVKAEIVVNKEKKCVEVTIYMNTYKQSAVLVTIKSHITNMINGVTKGYRYKMHEVHKHFPIDLQIKDNAVSIIKYLGQRDVKVIPLPEGVTCKKNPKDAGELWFEGQDVDLIALTCSKVFESCFAKDKDRRKFLDGIFTSEKGLLEE